MKIRVIENSWLAEFLKVGGITLYPFIFIVCSLKIAKRGYLLGHEFVHVDQIEDHFEVYSVFGWPIFYLTYIFLFLINYAKYRNWDKAYRNIRFERQARKNERHRKKSIPSYI